MIDPNAPAFPAAVGQMQPGIDMRTHIALSFVPLLAAHHHAAIRCVAAMSDSKDAIERLDAKLSPASVARELFAFADALIAQSKAAP